MQIAVQCADIPENQPYTHQELIAARLQWLGHEARIPKLKLEANRYNRANVDYDYVCNFRVIAKFNAQAHEVSTPVPQGRSIILSYGDFDEFIGDIKLSKEAKTLLARETRASHARKGCLIL